MTTDARSTPETDAYAAELAKIGWPRFKVDAQVLERMKEMERRLAESEAHLVDYRKIIDNDHEALTTLQAAYDKALVELRQVESLRRINARRQERNKVQVGIPCACEFDENDEPTVWCLPHSELRDERDKTLAELVNLRDDYLRQHVKLTDTQARVRELEEREQSICDECEHYDKAMARVMELEGALLNLHQAYINKHSPQHRTACLNEASTVLRLSALMGKPDGA